MTDDEPSTQEQRTLQELFVEMTGERGVTRRQDEGTSKRVVDADSDRVWPGGVEPPGTDALEDAIEDPEPD